MLDMRKIYSGTGANISTADIDVKAWSAFDHTQTNANAFCQMGMFQWHQPGEVLNVFNIDHYELPKPPLPPQHRYWYPECTDGYEAMQIATKCRLFSLGSYDPGEPMLVRYYFWTDRDKLNSIPTYYHIAGLIMSCVTDIIDVIEPIPDGVWQPPIWKPLPSVLPTHPPDRRAVLLAAQIRS